MWSFLFIREYMECLVLLRKDTLFTYFSVFFFFRYLHNLVFSFSSCYGNYWSQVCL